MSPLLFALRCGFRIEGQSGGSARRLGCRPTHQACRSRALWQRAILSATTWREGPFLTTPTLPSSLPGQQLQLQPLHFQAWPHHPTMALLHPWQPHSAWALSWAQLLCFATLPSLDPILAGKPPPSTDLPWTRYLFFFTYFNQDLPIYVPAGLHIHPCILQ